MRMTGRYEDFLLDPSYDEQALLMLMEEDDRRWREKMKERHDEEEREQLKMMRQAWMRSSDRWEDDDMNSEADLIDRQLKQDEEIRRNIKALKTVTIGILLFGLVMMLIFR